MSETGLPEQVHLEITNKENDCLKVALEAMSNSINGLLRLDEKHEKEVIELTQSDTTNDCKRSKESSINTATALNNLN
jgi:hypothetical protein